MRLNPETGRYNYIITYLYGQSKYVITLRNLFRPSMRITLDDVTRGFNLSK